MRSKLLLIALCISTLLCSATEISPYYMTEYVYTENFDEIGTLKRSDNVPFKLKRIRGEAERFLYREGETVKIREKMVDKLFQRDFWTLLLEVEVEKKTEQISFCIVRDEFNTNGVVARYGYCVDHAPKNSLQAFRQAMEKNCQGSLVEVKLTPGNALVTCVESVSENDLPPLSAFLDEAVKQNGTYLFCELKPQDATPEEADRIVRSVLSEVKQKNAQEWVYYLTSNVEVLKALLRYEPEEFIMYTNDDLSPAELKRMGCRMVAYDKDVLRTKLHWIGEGRNVGTSISVKGANARDEMLFYLDNNVDNIITERPDLLLKVVKGGLE